MTKTLTRPEFDALGTFERALKMREGYRVVDPPPRKEELKAPRILGPKELTRQQFDALDHHERAQKMLSGWRVVD